MTKIQISVQRLKHGNDLPLPQNATEFAAGIDLLAAIYDPLTLKQRERKIIPTGISIAIPIGFEAQVRSRSGLAINDGVTVLNSPGTIDADYRGEIFVILMNHSEKEFTIKRGTRIAQLIFKPVISVEWKETTSLPKTKRGIGGFGSTGSELV